MEPNADLSRRENLEITLKTMFQIFFAEFFGTAILLYVGCSGGIIGFGAFTFGPAVALATQAVGHISGAHINPAVTIAALIMGEVKLKYVPVYIIAEFIGAFTGYAILYASVFMNMDEEPVNICITYTKEIHVLQALALETILTSGLVMMYCALWHTKSNTSTVGALVLGLSMSAIQIGFRPFSGASINTPRSFAPALIKLRWNNHWIYWVGPTAGGVIGALIYRFLLMNGPLTDELKKET